MDLHSLDPTSHMSGGQYVATWQYIFAHFLQGFWARFFGVVFLFLAGYFGIRRRNFQMFAVFFICALMVTFIGYPLARLVGML